MSSAAAAVPAMPAAVNHKRGGQAPTELDDVCDGVKRLLDPLHSSGGCKKGSSQRTAERTARSMCLPRLRLTYCEEGFGEPVLAHIKRQELQAVGPPLQLVESVGVQRLHVG